MFVEIKLIDSMRKFGVLLSIFVLLTAFTCENEPLEGDFVSENPSSCEDAIAVTAQAALDFIGVNDDNYTTLCVAYRNALEAQIDACGDPDGSLQLAVNDLGNCDNNQPLGVAGTWLLTAWNVVEPLDLNNDGTENTNLLDEMDCYTNETLVLNGDNTGTAMSTSYAEFDIFIEAGTENSFDFTINCIEEIENTNVTWTQDGNIVSIDDGFSVSDWTLVGNTLSITIPEGFSVINAEDAEVTVTQDLTFIYTKQ